MKKAGKSVRGTQFFGALPPSCPDKVRNSPDRPFFSEQMHPVREMNRLAINAFRSIATHYDLYLCTSMIKLGEIWQANEQR